MSAGSDDEKTLMTALYYGDVPPLGLPDALADANGHELSVAIGVLRWYHLLLVKYHKDGRKDDTEWHVYNRVCDALYPLAIAENGKADVTGAGTGRWRRLWHMLRRPLRERKRTRR
ncbi:hypothetical protein DSM100688_0425 [Bifidobacterium ramosum]|uniref:Uncharacterized protein n=1 Tax=Bifidobacterium ramosum TaxID=1798158 RepID=A0A6L4X322_9BIFI|nr:hypothetical protein [Bifidobacterium ramosum]KAB8289345.1 hypothetical protein DSM100688_0425 [Bifidobacterium ramosum]NEG71043.1 hypothetical protein [Bifidobacterium ramosum]